MAESSRTPETPATTVWDKVTIPEVKVGSEVLFIPDQIYLTDQLLNPRLSYSDWFSVEPLVARSGSNGWANKKANGETKPPEPPISEGGAPPGGAPDMRGLTMDTVHRFEEMILMKDAMGTHVDTFKEGDDSNMALAIATTGVATNLGQVLAKYDLVHELFDKIIPKNSVRNRLSSNLKLVTHAQVLAATTDLLRSIPGLQPADPMQRQYLTMVTAEILIRVGGAFVGIIRRRDITLTRSVNALFPTFGDFNLFMQATWIKKCLTALDALIASQKAKREVSFEVMVTSIAEILLSFGNEMMIVTQQNNALKIAAGVVKWFVTQPLVLDFPPEMRANTNLLALAGNATFVKYALDQAPSEILKTLSSWSWAMENVMAALKDPAYFRTIRLSEFESYCGLSRVEGAKNAVKALLFWMNLPGSNPPYAFLEAEIDAKTHIGETPQLTDVTNTLGIMTAQLMRRTGQDWFADIQEFIVNILIDRQVRSSPPTEGKEAALTIGSTSPKQLDYPLFIRFGAPAEAVWYYTLARIRTVYPRYTSIGKNTIDRVMFDFVVPVEKININLDIPIYEGTIRTSDERIALLGVKDVNARSPLPCQNDGLPEENRDDLLFLNQVPVFKDFNTNSIVWDVVLSDTRAMKINASTWLTMLAQPPYLKTRVTDPIRTRLLVACWDGVLVELMKLVPLTDTTRIYLGNIRATLLKDVMTNNGAALQVHAGLLRSMINSIGDNMRRAELDSDLNRATNLVRLVCQLGAEVMVQQGCASDPTVKRWLAEMEDAKWFAQVGAVTTRINQFGLAH